jgi:hypothetical protein
MNAFAVRRGQMLQAAQLTLVGSAGSALVALFVAGVNPSIRVGIASLFAIGFAELMRLRLPRLGLLSRLMMVVYLMPCSVLLGYLFERDYVWMLTPRGMEVIADERLIAEMIALALIGLLGMIFGLRIAGEKPLPTQQPAHQPLFTLSIPFYATLAGLGVLLSWMSTPKETIFQAQYFLEQSGTIADQTNFAAAYLVSYLLLLVLYIDAEYDRRRIMRRFKFFVVIACVSYVVVFLQLLRGNRESSGLLAALFGLFVTHPTMMEFGRKGIKAARRRILLAFIPVSLLAIIFVSLGEARGTLSDVSAQLGPRQTFLLGLSQNTWTAVLWTQLGFSWQYREGQLHYRYGSTYRDYVTSLPPGFVAATFNIERPADTRNLAKLDPAGVSAGGLYVLVTPFVNFGALGVLLIMALYGGFIGWIERYHASGSRWSRFLYATVLCSSFQWFWYGDLAFIRALMSAVGVYLLYLFLVSLRRGSAPAIVRTAARQCAAS